MVEEQVVNKSLTDGIGQQRICFFARCTSGLIFVDARPAVRVIYVYCTTVIVENICFRSISVVGKLCSIHFIEIELYIISKVS